MRILHTADWHLGDRLGRVDRTDDLRVAVERIAAYCHSERVDVLLVAGDLFSELARPDGLRDAIRHWQETFADFLAGGGTILTLTGNHDNENFCQTLRHAMALAAPVATKPGETIAPGRLYLAAEPTLLRLRDRSGSFNAQFILMPYPTPTRYLAGEAGQRYASPEEKNRLLVTAFEQTMNNLRTQAAASAAPIILAAHAHVRGAAIGPGLFRISEQEDIVVGNEGLADQFAYVALGHIHKPQALGGCSHIRYSGSIERMDLGEQSDAKSAVLVEVAAKGLVAEPVVLPLPATRVYEVSVTDPAHDLPRLRAEATDTANDLVNLHIRYTAGQDNLEEILRELDAIFPRWYARDWIEAGRLGPSIVGADAIRSQGFAETVRDYLSQELLNHDDADRAAILERTEVLLKEME